MYSPAQIRLAHIALEKICFDSQVLFGGSYLYGEADQDSDADFYVICGRQAFNRLRKNRDFFYSIKKIIPKAAIMLVPHFFLFKNFYYIYGQDHGGHVSYYPVNEDVLLKSCLRLAYFNFLCFRALPDEKQRRLRKVLKNVCLTFIKPGKQEQSEPIFSWRYIKANLRRAPTEVSVELDRIIVALERPSSNQDLERLGRSLFELMNHCFESNKSKINRLSWSNYLLYNIKNLHQARVLFLFNNPDKLLIQRLRLVLKHGVGLQEFTNEISQMILPVIIF